jgi:nucleoside 2-deoxyribosyltransferase
MRQYKVYLSGPIASLSPAEALSWREYAKFFLSTQSDNQVIGICPMRHSTYKNTGRLDRKEIDILKDKQACYTRDKYDIKDCDLVFVNVIKPPDRISMGTNIEVGWADAFGKPIIAVSDKDGTYDKDLLFSATIDIMYYDLDIGLKRCIDFLLP